MTRFLILLLIGSLTYTLPASADQTDSLAVYKAAENLLAASCEGNPDILSSFFLAENSVFGPDGGPRSVFNANFLHSEIEAGLRYKLQWKHLTVKVYGTTAVTTGYAIGTITQPNGTVQTGSWRSSLVWVKTDGKWKVAHDHTSELFPNRSNQTS